MPNLTIPASIKEKQKRYPKAIYVRDYKKVLVNARKKVEDSNNVLAFNKNGKL